MKFYFDENIPWHIAGALDLLEKSEARNEVFSTFKEWGQGILDPDLIPLVGKEKGFLITHDLKQKSRSRENKLFFEKNVSVFIISFPSGVNYWEMVKKIFKEWEFIKHAARKHPKPFVCRIKMRGDPEFLFENNDK